MGSSQAFNWLDCEGSRHPGANKAVQAEGRAGPAAAHADSFLPLTNHPLLPTLPRLQAPQW